MNELNNTVIKVKKIIWYIYIVIRNNRIIKQIIRRKIIKYNIRKWKNIIMIKILKK